MSEEKAPARQRVGSDFVLPVVGVCYAVYYVWSVWDFPLEARRSGLFLAGLLLLLCGLFFVRTLLQALRGRVEWEFTALLGPPEGRLNRLGFLLLIGGYLWFVEPLGFTLATFVFLLVGSLLAGIPSWRKAVVFASTASILGYLFFLELLGTRFPRGPFEALVAQMVSPWS